MSTHNVLFSTLAGILLLSACSTDYFVQTEGNLPSKNDVLEVLNALNIDPLTRAESLSLEDFINITNKICEKYPN